MRPTKLIEKIQTNNRVLLMIQVRDSFLLQRDPWLVKIMLWQSGPGENRSGNQEEFGRGSLNENRFL